MAFRRILYLLGICAALVVFASTWLILPSIVDDPDQQPETATGWREVSVVSAQRSMVVTAHPLASSAGMEILLAGGSAIDAAVAIQAMLTLVEPQSSGIGGGAFLLHYDAQNAELAAWDGRETAPAGVSSRLFLHTDGTPLAFMKALIGGRSVGVPGVLKMLAKVHEISGKLPWKRLFEPVIRVAREGFSVTPRLHLLLSRDLYLRAMPAARALFYPYGKPLAVGDRFRNPDLADAFELVAIQGTDVFYAGELADHIVAAVQHATQPAEWALKSNFRLMNMGIAAGLGEWGQTEAPGLLTKSDLAGYRPKKREPICITYREFKVCGHPPPTSGGVTALQMLGILRHFELGAYGPKSTEAAHLLAEAGKLAFADRNRYIGDPDFVDLDVRDLLKDAYLESRAKLIKKDKSLKKIKAGKFPEIKTSYIPDSYPSFPSTSHFNVVDESGDIVSMTTSVENVFGSRLVVDGFILNNQLTDFSFVPKRSGKLVANAPAAGKRPRSSMAPLIVFRSDTKEPVFAVGSAGGSRIIGFVVQAVVAVLDWGLDPQEALNLPHMLARREPMELENEGWKSGELKKLTQDLRALGHTVRVGPLNSGVHSLKLSETLEGGVDPRREGMVAGH
ncbi:MAG: gamma-glutamyltransferase family protein [Myxococcales bacterium]|nr:gamma-glutamyltransferase family protein [Myxococcales bacterium]